MDTFKLSRHNFEGMTEETIREKRKLWDASKWQEEVNSKTTLTIYKTWKKQMEQDTIHDNHPSSIILYKARANCLPLKNRNRHTIENTRCLIYEINKDLEHFLLFYPSYHSEIIKKKKHRPATTLRRKQKINYWTLLVQQKLHSTEKKESLNIMWKIKDKKIEE